MASINKVSISDLSSFYGHEENESLFKGKILINNKCVGCFIEDEWNKQCNTDIANPKDIEKIENVKQAFFDKFGFTRYKGVKPQIGNLIKILLALQSAEAIFTARPENASVAMTVDEKEIHIYTILDDALKKVNELLKAANWERAYAILFENKDDFSIIV